MTTKASSQAHALPAHHAVRHARIAGHRAHRRRRSGTPAARWSSGLLAGGVVVFAAGAAADLAYHLFPPLDAALWDVVMGDGGQRAHEITLAGMAVLVAGLLVRGVSHAR